MVVGEGVDVRDDRDLGVADVGGGDRLAQAFAGGRHVRRVEGARHRQRHHPRGAELLGELDAASTPTVRPGDHDLAGSVEVGDPDLVVGEVAGDLDLVVVEAEHGGHRARTFQAGVVHRRRPLDDEPDALLEVDRPGGRERGVLAEAVPGAEAGVDADALDGVEHHQARHERGELRVAGVLQFVGVGVEQQLADVTPGDLARLVDQLPALVIDPRPTHAWTLRSLTGERECEHWRRG